MTKAGLSEDNPRRTAKPIQSINDMTHNEYAIRDIASKIRMYGSETGRAVHILDAIKADPYKYLPVELAGITKERDYAQEQHELRRQEREGYKRAVESMERERDIAVARSEEFKEASRQKASLLLVARQSLEAERHRAEQAEAERDRLKVEMREMMEAGRVWTAKWTTRKPIIAGHYWCICRGALSGREYATIVHVYTRSTALGSPVDTVFWDGENCNLTQDSFVRWSDQPIPVMP